MFPLFLVGKWVLFVSSLETGEGPQLPSVHVGLELSMAVQWVRL